MALLLYLSPNMNLARQLDRLDFKFELSRMDLKKFQYEYELIRQHPSARFSYRQVLVSRVFQNICSPSVFFTR